jgi:hypothetical protein
MEKRMMRDFKMEMLKKVMAVIPSMYDHHFDMKSELVITVKENLH